MSHLNIDSILKSASKKQKLIYSKMKARERSKYLLSFLGAKTDEVCTTIDLPEVKSKPLIDFKKLRRDLEKQYSVCGSKTPLYSAPDWVGIEIECYLPKDSFDGSYSNCDGSCREDCECMQCQDCGQCDENRDCNCECNDSCRGNEEDHFESVKRSLEQAKIKGIGLDTDGSLTDEPRDYFGIEIKILTRVSDTKNLEKLCAWLKNHDAKITKKCGLHVHLDTKGIFSREKTKLEDTFSNMLPVLSKMVSPSRLNNRYCTMRVSSEKFSAVNTGTDFDTIEVRLHNGTCDFAKISNWIQFLQKIKVYALSDGNENNYYPNSLTVRLARYLSLTDENFEFLKARIAKFRGDTGDLLIEDMGSEESAA